MDEWKKRGRDKLTFTAILFFSSSFCHEIIFDMRSSEQSPRPSVTFANRLVTAKGDQGVACRSRNYRVKAIYEVKDLVYSGPRH